MRSSSRRRAGADAADPSEIVASSPSVRKPAAVNAAARVPSEKASFAASATAALWPDASSPAMAAPALSTTDETIWSLWAWGIPWSAREAPRIPAVLEYSTVPSTATPSAAPSCREVDCVPDAWPPSEAGTSARTTPVSWAVASPTPRP